MSTDPCHTAGTAPSPWVDDPRADAKDALLRYAVNHPEGAPVIVAARSVLAVETAGDANHRLALRFYDGHPDLFKTDTRDGLRWVEPRNPAFTRPANNHSPKHGEGDGTTDDTSPVSPKTGGTVETRPSSPRANARDALAGRRVVDRDTSRGMLLDALATYRETTEDRFHQLDRVRGRGEETLLVPYVTRFNAPSRVADSRERVETAFDAARGRFERAVMVTLTSDPKRHESVAAAGESLLADVSRFKSWVATDSRIGHRPPSVVIPEFTDSGLPHAHVVLFGVSWVVAHAELSAYWSHRRDRGEVVWFDRLSSRGESGRWRWSSDGPTDAEGRPPRSYLLKSHDALAGVASASPKEVRSAARSLRSSDREPTDDGREWWRIAMYYALDMTLATVSPTLKPSTDGGSDPDDDLPHVTQYEYVGTARYGEFPAHVRNRAVVLSRRGRPPPV